MDLVKLGFEFRVRDKAVFVNVKVIQELFDFLVAQVLDLIIGHTVDWLAEVTFPQCAKRMTEISTLERKQDNKPSSTN